MVATAGSIRHHPHRHSGAARLWRWTKTRRRPWTSAQAAEGAGVSERRIYDFVAAFHTAGLLECVQEATTTAAGVDPTLWTLSATGRALAGPPVLIVQPGGGPIIGVRLPDGETA